MAKQIVSFRGTMGTSFTLVSGSTVPTGKELLVTDIWLTNKHASTETIGTVAVGTSTASNTIILQGKLKSSESGTQGCLNAGCNTRIIAGEGLYVKAGDAGSIDYYISGVLRDV